MAVCGQQKDQRRALRPVGFPLLRSWQRAAGAQRPRVVATPSHQLQRDRVNQPQEQRLPPSWTGPAPPRVRKVRRPVCALPPTATPIAQPRRRASGDDFSAAPCPHDRDPRQRLADKSHFGQVSRAVRHRPLTSKVRRQANAAPTRVMDQGFSPCSCEKITSNAGLRSPSAWATCGRLRGTGRDGSPKPPSGGGVIATSAGRL